MSQDGFDMNIPHRRHASSAGFTLIEVIIVIAIMAIVAGAMAPLAVRTIDSGRRDVTIKRQQEVHRAIFGDPSAPGSGFLSDIGRFPTTGDPIVPDFAELAVQGSLPTYSIQPCGVGMGWRGPYLLDGVDASGRPLDGWGQPMDYVGGQIRSGGPDRNMATAADNIVYPSMPITNANIHGSLDLTATVLDTSGPQPVYVAAGGPVTVSYAEDGRERNMPLSSPTGVYLFPSPASGLCLPQGIYAVTAKGDPDGIGVGQPEITRVFTVYCPGGGTVHQTIALK
jgi:prepilin-type N-terminal cleavage/methylation domain-containing protein